MSTNIDPGVHFEDTAGGVHVAIYQAPYKSTGGMTV
jgi:hypothetical protein